MIALKILGKQDDVVRALLARSISAIGMLALRNISLHPDDWLYARGLHLIVKRDCAVEIAVIGDGDGTRIQLLSSLGKRLDLDRPIQEAEVRMEMKMHKVFFVHFCLCSLRSRSISYNAVTAFTRSFSKGAS